MSLLLYQSKELSPRSRVIAEQAPNGRGHGLAARLLHTAGAHAQVLPFHDDHTTVRLQHLFYNIRNLRSDSLLYLQSAGHRFHEPGKFAESGNLAARNIPDMNLAEKKGAI